MYLLWNKQLERLHIYFACKTRLFVKRLNTLHESKFVLLFRPIFRWVCGPVFLILNVNFTKFEIEWSHLHVMEIWSRTQVCLDFGYPFLWIRYRFWSGTITSLSSVLFPNKETEHHCNLNINNMFLWKVL